MAKVVVMPKLGLTMKEGEVTKWYKREGEEVNKGEPLFEVATDKITNDVEATESGILKKVLMEEGQSTSCLNPVAIIAQPNEDISSLLGPSNSSQESEPTRMEVAVEKMITDLPMPGGKMKASPVAKKFASEHRIDLAFVTGTGPNGRIVLEDVQTYLKNPSAKVKASPMAEKVAAQFHVDLKEINKDSRIMRDDVLSFMAGNISDPATAPEAIPMSIGTIPMEALVAPVANHTAPEVIPPETQAAPTAKRSEIGASQMEKDGAKNTEYPEVRSEQRVPMSQMRKVIANRMADSWRISPAVTFDIKVDMTRLKELRRQLKDMQNVTFTDLLVKITAAVLMEFPYVNSSIENSEIILRNYANIGVAVALEGGLIVPVIKNAHQKGLKQISNELKELAEKAKNNQLSSDEFTGGTFTITNLGMYGIEAFSPIINQPEVAILGVNTITETPVVVNGEIAIVPMMNLSLTADHRVVDGAVAAQFLARLKQYIEKPEILLL